MFFLTYILQYIFSLSKNTHTCPIFVCVFSWQQIGSGQSECGGEKITMMMLINVETFQSDSLIDLWNSQNGSGWCCKTNWLRCCYNGHLEHPHSRAVSSSSEYEVPSLQRKTTFLFLLLVTPQQTPGGAAAWQDLGQSIRGILLVDVHVRIDWWRFSCSLTISPWHVSSGHWWQRDTY